MCARASRKCRTAQQLLDDNKRQVQIGALAEIEITRAEAQLYASQQDLVVSQTNLQQQETVLKNALCRNGISAAGLENVHVVPLDKIEVPASDDVRPVPELVNQALGQPQRKSRKLAHQYRKQPDESGGHQELIEAHAAGLRRADQQRLDGRAHGPAGARNPASSIWPAATAICWRRSRGATFPNYSAGFSLNIPLRNRAAQSDYATSQLELRQNQLNLRKNINQVTVDVQNAVIGLQQARARYDAATKARELQQQTLRGDQRRYALGATTVFQVIQDQRDLASSESTESQAMANYTHARIAFDQALGTTLEVNHISLDEALRGRHRARFGAAGQSAREAGNDMPRRKFIAIRLCLASLTWAQEPTSHPSARKRADYRPAVPGRSPCRPCVSRIRRASRSWCAPALCT